MSLKEQKEICNEIINIEINKSNNFIEQNFIEQNIMCNKIVCDETEKIIKVLGLKFGYNYKPLENTQYSKIMHI